MCPWPWPWAHPWCALIWISSCASLIAIDPFAHEKKRFLWDHKSARITWPLTLTSTLSTPWMRAHLETIVCKFGRNRATCLVVEAICAESLQDGQTDRQTDRRRTPRGCISSWNELKKLPILAAPLRFIVPSAANSAKIRTNLICSGTTVHWPHFCRWDRVKAQCSVTRGQPRKLQHNTPTSGVQSKKRTLSWIGHSGSFKVKVIPIGVGRNPERGVDLMYNNVIFISETYEDIATATGKLQIPRFRQSHSGFTTVLRENLLNIYR